MHRHLSQVQRHLINQVVHSGGCVRRSWDVGLLLGRQASLAHVADSEHFLKVYAKEIKHGWCWDFVVDRFENVQFE